MSTPADELRAAADKLAPVPEVRPTLVGEYPDLDACYAQLLRDTAETVDAVVRHGLAVDEHAHWLQAALAAARKINGGRS
ncbi:hypothetical protein ACIRJM_23115 [Streptomyces sp. NPDC102405]|uniref:hypothetical protein n=1 Tax=Streptomyces sp. NPDC102405 TaxID=3366170 RepID=UPI00382816C2